MVAPSDQINLATLPIDVLLIVSSYLNATDFLSLCRSSKQLYHDEELRFSASFWRFLTQRTFRIPNRPVVQADGQRWMNLYRRIHREARIYCWGQHKGEPVDAPTQGGRQIMLPRHNIRGRHQAFPRARSSGWPRPLQQDSLSDVGLVVDLQAGGWSTVMLNSRGGVFMCGKINGENTRNVFHDPVNGRPKRLSFPSGYNPATKDSPADYYDPWTAIEQVSTGRAHILGLSDTGTIWTWSRAHAQGLRVKFMDVDTVQGPKGAEVGSGGRATKVAAGWKYSSAYVKGTGIVVWDPVIVDKILQQQPVQDQAGLDTALVSDTWTVPDSGYQRGNDKVSDETKAQLDRVGQVTNWIVLDNFLVFLTDANKVFAFKIPQSNELVQDPFEIRIGVPEDGLMDRPAVLDIYGSFTNFGILRQDGEVLISHEDSLVSLHQGSEGSAKKIPSLQRTGVISLAFGDYHFLALHANGTITAHGHESLSEGALGLGENGSEKLRGVQKFGAHLQDNVVPDACETTGRQVYFDQEKKAWLEHLVESAMNSEEAVPRLEEMQTNLSTQAEYSEWIEQRLRGWDEGGGEAAEAKDANDDQLPAYFALSVAAAGWHSGALILVNQDKARASREAHRLRTVAPAPAATAEPPFGSPPDGSAAAAQPDQWAWEGQAFPRLRLRNGQEMTGTVPLEADWTCPEVKDVEQIALHVAPRA